MDALKRLLLTIAIGTVLGFVLWWLASRDTMPSIGWIAIGIALVTGTWLTWGTSNLLVSIRHQTPAPEPTVLTRYLPPPNSLENLQSRLKIYAMTYFASVGLLLLGWSQRSSTEPDLKWLPQSVVFVVPSPLTLALVAACLLLALTAVVASASQRVAAIAHTRPRWLLIVEPLVSVLAVSSLIVAWYAGIPAISGLSAGYVYAYVYGGLAFLLAFTALTIWDWYAIPPPCGIRHRHPTPPSLTQPIAFGSARQPMGTGPRPGKLATPAPDTTRSHPTHDHHPTPHAPALRPHRTRQQMAAELGTRQPQPRQRRRPSS